MRPTLALASGLLALGLCGPASADEYIFTATSGAAGVLGSFEIDASALDDTVFQFVDNSELLDVSFTDPIKGTTVDVIGPAGQGVFIDDTGALPTVAGGSGVIAGTTVANGVYLASNTFVSIAGTRFYDVSWSTQLVTPPPAPVPEPAGYAVLLAGLSLLAVAARRRRR